MDDEKLERVLIRNGFDWSQNGFEIIGEAQSGQEALEFVQYRKPDIVLTDISMPEMDGLELAERILKNMADCHIVIITGYREFDYARRAVKIGVEDFLLKPVNIDELEHIAQELKEKITKERTEKEVVEQRKQSDLFNKDILRESFFQRLVENRISKEEAIQKMRIYNCRKLCESCVCVNIKLEEYSNKENQERLHCEILNLILEQKYENVVYFVHYMQNIIIYFMKQEFQDVCTKTHKLQKLIQEKYQLSSVIGISSIQQTFEGIAIAFAESERALNATIYLGKDQCVTYQEYEEVMKKNPGKQDINWEDFMFAVNNCIRDKVHNYIEEYTELVRASKVPDVEYLRLMTMNLLLKAGSTLNRYGTGLEQLLGEDELYVQVRGIHSVDEMRQYLGESVNVILEFHESKKVKQVNKVVNEALDYINENLFDSELTLKMVASQIYTNESYLSRVFKKEVGQSLIEYITKKRIEESIQLMNTTDLKVYEIAEKIGFRDAHYFSICFKKQTGITIKEFRK